MVSVIIPTYNYARYLGDTLDSLLNQSYENWECIVVDDGSTDDTRNVVQSYCKKDPRIQYHFQENKGVSAARNLGLEQAKGTYIQFLDGDDMLQAQKLKQQVEFLENHPETELTFSNFIHVQDQSEMNHTTGELPELHHKNYSGSEALQKLLKGNFIRIHQPLFRREILQRTGMFNATFRSVEDWDLWLRFALNDVRFTYYEAPETHAVIRSNSNGLSKDLRTMKKYYLPLWQGIFFDKRLTVFQRIRILSRCALVTLDYLFQYRNGLYLRREKAFLFGILLSITGLLLLPVFILNRIKNLVL